MNLKTILRGLLATLILLPALGAAEDLPACDPMPKPLIKPVPKYPKIVAGPPRAHVTLRFTIGTDGWVTDVIVTDNWPMGSEQWFDEPAIETIKRTRFKDVTTGCRATLRLEFRRPAE
jgi:outer membrane biosynthesis protein TonB